jgi:cytochrome d ubiquinol oxidase subunit II
LIPALLWGVAFANFLRGVSGGCISELWGGIWNLLNPYALFAGLLTTTDSL